MDFIPSLMGHGRTLRRGTRSVLCLNWLGVREDIETEGDSAHGGNCGDGTQKQMPQSGLVTLPTLSLQDLETRNVELEHQLRVTERSLEEARAERERARAEVGRAAQLLDVRLFELSELREGLARLAEGAP